MALRVGVHRDGGKAANSSRMEPDEGGCCEAHVARPPCNRLLPSALEFAVVGQRYVLRAAGNTEAL